FGLHELAATSVSQLLAEHLAASELLLVLAAEARRRSAWASRKLRLLRAHGLIYKVTGTHRYHLTKAGRIATTAILTALRSSVRQLTAAAA
ncbi:MAG TPA: hypothetical protein VJO72_16280, partial [Candidatus Dormibacteraeota bacterium]|nr:hypothetical protein [Candidatus Dormibacteraeota bacterium]